jgi:glycosyltransferase involved in cell wall biosynthesis
VTAPTRISVVIPTFNASGRLKTTIESVLAQTSPPLEIIIVDDGSTDDTMQVCASFGSAITYLAVANGGQQRARNRGVDQASGDWIAFLDHDDLWHPDYLAEIRALQDRQVVDLIFCNSLSAHEQDNATVIQHGTRFTQLAPAGYWQSIDVDTECQWSVLPRYDYARFLAFHPVQPSVLTIRNDTFQRLGGFDPRMRGISAENFEFELRAIRLARVGLIWRPLVTITRHPGNASVDGSKMAMDVITCLKFAQENHDLTAVERHAVEAELQRRLPDAIDGAFTLRRFQALRDYRAMLATPPDMKARIKFGVARLPRSVANICAGALAR